MGNKEICHFYAEMRIVKGRAAIFAAFMYLIRKLILENRTGDLTKAMQNGEFYGMNTFDQSLAQLYKTNLVHLLHIIVRSLLAKKRL